MRRNVLYAFLLTTFACDGGTPDDKDDTDTDTQVIDTDVTPTGETVVLVDGQFDLLLGETTMLSARTVNGAAESYQWTSSDDTVVSVDSEGLVVARKLGAAIVSATGETSGLTGTLGVVVSVDTPYRDAWARSGHADITAEAFNHWNEEGEVEANCARCHSTTGFQDFTGADGTAAESIDVTHPAGGVLACTTCHNETADALSSVTFPSGVTVDGLGGEARCMTCHQGRSSTDSVDAQIAAANVDDDVISTQLSFQNIHYYAAGATLLAGKVRGGYQYEDQVYDHRFRHAPGFEHCDDCHDPHSLEVEFEACAECHPGVTDTESVHNIRMLPSFGQDYNGNGNTNEGMYFEVRGLRTSLLTAISRYPAASGGAAICYDEAAYPYWFIDTNSSGATCDAAEAAFPNRYVDWTPRLMRAAYNYQVATKDPGSWAHNANYTIKLLFDSITDLNPVLPLPVDLTSADRNDKGHFNGASEAARNWESGEPLQSSCSKCHGGSEGFRFYVTYGATKVVDAPDNGLDCYTCHDDFQTFDVLPVANVTFPNGHRANLPGDHTNVCATCHSGRESGASVQAAIDAGSPGFKNIHYLPAAATMQGATAHMGYEYDVVEGYDDAWTDHPGGSGCVDCHVVTLNNHSHNVVDNFQRCQTGCHLNAQSPGDIRGNGRSPDYDGDGDSDEPLADEIATLRDRLLEVILSNARDAGHPLCKGEGYPYWFNDTNGNGTCESTEQSRSNAFSFWTGPLAAAVFNHQFATVEPGAWAHNFNYMGQLLYDSYRDLGGDTTGMVRP